jgi:uncharacterized cupin superfamily protein
MHMMQSIAGLDHELEPAGREARVVSGDCETSATQLAVHEGLRFGVWECTPGEWHSTWNKWESFTVISGRGELVDGDGGVHVLAPGTTVIVPAGSTGVWRVEETLRKAYVAPPR